MPNTSIFNFYKSTDNEFVDVDRHLNDNWNRLDREVKRLMEYRYTNVTSINDYFTDKRPMHRFYKTWSNAIIWENFSSNLTQDPSAKVYAWTSAKTLLGADWSIRKGNGLYYRIISREDLGTVWVEWVGSIEYQNGILIPPYTQFDNVIDLPSDIAPKMSRYYECLAGNCSAGFSIARSIFNRLGHVDIIRYGTNPDADQNKIDFSNVKYDLNLVGT